MSRSVIGGASGLPKSRSARHNGALIVGPASDAYGDMDGRQGGAARVMVMGDGQPGQGVGEAQRDAALALYEMLKSSKKMRQSLWSISSSFFSDQCLTLARAPVSLFFLRARPRESGFSTSIAEPVPSRPGETRGAVDGNGAAETRQRMALVGRGDGADDRGAAPLCCLTTTRVVPSPVIRCSDLLQLFDLVLCSIPPQVLRAERRRSVCTDRVQTTLAPRRRPDPAMEWRQRHSHLQSGMHQEPPQSLLPTCAALVRLSFICCSRSTPARLPLPNNRLASEPTPALLPRSGLALRIVSSVASHSNLKRIRSLPVVTWARGGAAGVIVASGKVRGDR